MSTADLIFGRSEESLRKHPTYGNLSLVTVSSPNVIWAYEEAMALEGKGIVQPIGVSRTDRYFDERFINSSKAAIEEAVPQAAGKRVLLYAPTFRGDVRDARAFERLDIAKLAETLADGWVLLINHHPFIKRRPIIPSDLAHFAFDVTDVLSIDRLLCAAAACMTDYSSVIFEFSLFERPMIFFAPDMDEYCGQRGFYYPYERFIPGPLCIATEQVVQAVRDIDCTFDSARIRAFRQVFMSACDGRATGRILDKVMDDAA